MLLRGAAMVTMATESLYLSKISCHGYHSSAPEQHKIISRIRIFSNSFKEHIVEEFEWLAQKFLKL